MQQVRGCVWEGMNNLKMLAEWNFFCCGGCGRNMETDHTHSNPLLFWHVWKKRTENTCFNQDVLQICCEQLNFFNAKFNKSSIGLLGYIFSHHRAIFELSSQANIISNFQAVMHENFTAWQMLSQVTSQWWGYAKLEILTWILGEGELNLFFFFFF